MSPTDSLTTIPHQQPDLLPKPQDILVPYLILDIEDYLAEATEEPLRGTYLPTANKARLRHFQSDHDNNNNNNNNKNTIPFLKSLFSYKFCSTWQQWATNPYNLHPAWHLFIMFLLLGWIVGSSVCGYYEVGPELGSVRVARFCRGLLGSVPPMIQLLLFLYPPLFVQF
ncbi:hypothetical protein COCSADRAFT_183264 [Bipolaris sorokiniana ND90Pr]|uniref:Uncharacterized protein n=1 Tax=Cochliobolus sativus (strain ND90Pr / ATCC 201652) TaxID=665912 RepID=M2S4R9_COCSN|nr:uncharacterized protein COCSADRAFT_183264 [Bipolaris sorokiniana ND90Pr]EMD62148.1 hypothetical protein COCSADRAFT_183264 [Bipolaris sorokiniana ND90Pr]